MLESTGYMNTKQQMNVGPFLAPIERPQGLIMKLAYHFTRRQFGKVLTPLQVHSARLPASFGLFYAKVGKLDKRLSLSPETVLLIRETVARISSPGGQKECSRAFQHLNSRERRRGWC